GNVAYVNLCNIQQDNDVPTRLICATCRTLPDMEVFNIFLCKQERIPFYQDVSGELLSQVSAFISEGRIPITNLSLHAWMSELSIQ
ncbi:MAG: hypothetical protein KZQ86_02610, partial [Candidatus Thiodiazotropha sp. (ex Lucinoma kastoroae)]|nr:hypothetical protein [Candidatus Thiodiazotropha sp. (ex Lucinoma kastoroae)]